MRSLCRVRTRSLREEFVITTRNTRELMFDTDLESHPPAPPLAWWLFLSSNFQYFVQWSQIWIVLLNAKQIGAGERSEFTINMDLSLHKTFKQFRCNNIFLLPQGPVTDGGRSELVGDSQTVWAVRRQDAQRQGESRMWEELPRLWNSDVIQTLLYFVRTTRECPWV